MDTSRLRKTAPASGEPPDTYHSHESRQPPPGVSYTGVATLLLGFVAVLVISNTYVYRHAVHSSAAGIHAAVSCRPCPVCRRLNLEDAPNYNAAHAEAANGDGTNILNPLKLREHTMVKKSLIPGAGSGLFATRRIPAGHVIYVEHENNTLIIRNEQLETLKRSSETEATAKLLEILDSWSWVGSLVDTGELVGVMPLDDTRYVCHSDERNKVNSGECSQELFERIEGKLKTDLLSCQASLRDIEAGEEILEDYRQYSSEEADITVEDGLSASVGSLSKRKSVHHRVHDQQAESHRRTHGFPRQRRSKSRLEEAVRPAKVASRKHPRHRGSGEDP